MAGVLVLPWHRLLVVGSVERINTHGAPRIERRWFQRSMHAEEIGAGRMSTSNAFLHHLPPEWPGNGHGPISIVTGITTRQTQELVIAIVHAERQAR